jgi:hypothetical protein
MAVKSPASPLWTVCLKFDSATPASDILGPYYLGVETTSDFDTLIWPHSIL